MEKKERVLSDKEHRNQFLEATVANYLVLHWLESKKPEGNLLRGIQNAKAITSTTIDRLTSDYPDLKISVDVMLVALDDALHRLLIEESTDEQK